MSRVANPMFVCTAVSLAAFMEILDTTIANVALTHIAGDLGASTEESTWILTSYLLTNAIVLPASGWLSDRIGRKTFFLCCILGFTFSSFLCGIAPTLPWLIIFRLLQGIAGGGLQPSQQAIIKDSFPPEKLGMAFAVTGISTVFAPILGPALGGYITEQFSWRWIFFVNIPIGILAALLVKKYVQDVSEATAHQGGAVDFIGIGLLAVGLGTLQLALDNGEQYDWFADFYICLLLGIAFLTLIAVVVWMLHHKKPVLNLKLFAVPSFAMACIMTFFIGAFVNVTVMLMPMLVQKCFGYNAETAGMILVPGGIMMLFLLPLTGRLSGKIQPKYLVSFGLFLCAGSMWCAAGITPQTDQDTFVYLRILQAVGMPFLFVPVTALAFSKIPVKDSNNASAITVLMKNIGGSLGISLLTSYLVQRQQINQAQLVSHLTPDSWGYQAAVEQGVQFLPPQMAAMQIYQMVQQQAAILAYIDVFWLLTYIFFALAVLALIFLPKNKAVEF
jgi:MFS transporter, DHA2 family, multidrug resistance protein